MYWACAIAPGVYEAMIDFSRSEAAPQDHFNIMVNIYLLVWLVINV